MCELRLAWCAQEGLLVRYENSVSGRSGIWCTGFWDLVHRVVVPLLIIRHAWITLAAHLQLELLLEVSQACLAHDGLVRCTLTVQLVDLADLRLRSKSEHNFVTALE